MTRALLLIVGVATGVTALALVRIDLAPAASAGLCAVIAFVALRRSSAGSAVADLARFAIALLAVYTVGAEGIRECIDPSPVPAAVARLREAPPTDGQLATLGFPQHPASQMRVMTGGAIDAATFDEKATDGDIGRYRTVLATDDESARLRALGYALERCGTEMPHLNARSGWELVTARDPRAWLTEHGRPVHLARR